MNEEEEFLVEIRSEVTHLTRMRGPSADVLKNRVWEQVEEISPNEIAPVWEAYVQEVRVRPLYDWEKSSQ
jgi:hypothetical protein